MKRYGSSLAAGMLAALLVAAPAFSQACTVTMGSTSYPSIGAAVGVAPMVATINVDGSTGACKENVLIPNVTLRMILLGTNNATISGPSAASPALDVRVKGFLVQGFTITGGSSGIQLQRNANAVINSVTVQSTGGAGIVVDSMAFAVITNSTIQNNPGAGIQVAELASARIGANLPEDGGGYAPNTIQNNGGDGIVFSGKSTGQVIHNTIQGNGGNGISVTGTASVSTAGNVINANHGSGIAVSGRSYVELGVLVGTGVADPDTTTSPNLQFGVSAGAGAAVTGNVARTNPLSGNTSQFGPGANAFAAGSPTPATALNAVNAPFAFAGLMAGTWSGTCVSGTLNRPGQGSFGLTVAVDATVSGTYSGTDSGAIFGTVSQNGGLTASGTAGAATWQGALNVSNGALHGSGTWTLTAGTFTCNGTWSSY
jgi:parallel beta-helix repeat protein